MVSVELMVHVAILVTGLMLTMYSDMYLQADASGAMIGYFSSTTLNTMRLVGVAVFLLGHHLLLANHALGAKLLQMFQKDHMMGKFASLATAGAVVFALVLNVGADFDDANENASVDTFTIVMRVIAGLGVAGVAASFILPMINKNKMSFGSGSYDLSF